MDQFTLNSKFNPTGDQPQAIDSLVEGIKKQKKHQILLGVTGSGKTFTIANVINKINKPTLVIAHNKTLAAQLTSEYRKFFPDNAVEYFVSYYDYYQPEAYIPSTDTYIEKEATINDEIDRLRHQATQSLLTRKDVIIVASVSCIYGIGSPLAYSKATMFLEVGQTIDFESVKLKLIELQFLRNEYELKRGTFRIKGEIIEIMPVNKENIYRITTDNNKIITILEYNTIDPTKKILHKKITIFSAKHYVVTDENLDEALQNIKQEFDTFHAGLLKKGKILEAERIKRRTNYDLELIKEVGYCNGIENYSRHLDHRRPGEPPETLLSYFPKDFLLVIDESHVTIPQLNGMYAGDRSRKLTLIEHGFRLPSAVDNRPLNFNEFTQKINQTIYTTATPGTYELDIKDNLVEQIIRPTGLVDPELIIRKTKNQIEDLISEINITTTKNHRVLITTLTKKMAEDLTEFLKSKNIKVNYLHSSVETIERIKILSELREGKFDVLVGINLLREGLDLPEVSLVAILDADREGFLRSSRSLIQTIGRAARNIDGKVILYADTITNSINEALTETNRRRKIQLEYNKDNNITPKTIQKEIQSLSDEILAPEFEVDPVEIDELKININERIKTKTKEMNEASKNLQFELAAVLRDEIRVLIKMQKEKIKLEN